MVLTMPPFLPLVPAALYPTLSLALVGSGLLFMAWFFTLQVSNGQSSKPAASSSGSSGFGRFIQELLVAMVASVLLGFGLLFVCLNVGIYV